MAEQIKEQERLIEQLRQELDSKDGRIDMLKDAMDDMKESLKSSQEEATRLKSALAAQASGDSSMQQHLQELEELVKKTAQEKQEVQKERDYFEGLVDESTIEKQRLADHHQAELSDLREQIAELETANSGYQSAAADAGDAAAQELVSVRAQLKATEDKFEELRKKHGDYIMTKDDELAELDGQIERLKNEKEQLEIQVNALGNKIQELQEENDMLQNQKEVMGQRLSKLAASPRGDNNSAGFVVVEEEKAAPSMVEEEPPPISGFLEKGKKELFGWQWQRRYVLVKHPYILWATQETEIEDVHDPAQRERFNNWELLSGIISLVPVSDQPTMFDMRVPLTRKEQKEKTYRWRANTQSDRNEWVKRLKPLINRL